MAASPAWIIVGMIVMIIILSSVYFAKKKRAAPGTPGAPGAAATPTPSRGWNISGIIGVIILIIIISIFGLWVYRGANDIPNDVYNSKELKSFDVLGKCKDLDGELICQSNWVLEIPGKRNILTVKIFPADREVNLTKNLSVWSGPYFFRITHAKEQCDRPSGETDVYKGEIFYGGFPEYDCTASVLASGAGDQSEQLPIKIGTDWSRAIVFWRNTKNPSIWIGNYKIAFSKIKAKEQVEFGGDLKFSSDQAVRIKKIEVKY